jgi:hypothetical protein
MGGVGAPDDIDKGTPDTGLVGEEDEAMSGSISGMRIVVGSIAFVHAAIRTATERAPVIQGKQAPRPATEIGLGANSNEL